jgi:hypothetical protein
MTRDRIQHALNIIYEKVFNLAGVYCGHGRQISKSFFL